MTENKANRNKSRALSLQRQTDQSTNRQTNQQTNQRTEWLIESHATKNIIIFASNLTCVPCNENNFEGNCDQYFRMDRGLKIFFIKILNLISQI